MRFYVKYGKIDRLLAVARHALTYESEKKVVLFQDYAEQVWLPLKSKQVKETTLYEYKCYFNKHLLPEFNAIDLYDIRPFDVQSYFDSRSDLSLKTQKEHYNVLCTFFDYAINDENVLLPRNPARSKHVTVKYSEKDSHIRDVHPPEMIREIIEEIEYLLLMQCRLMALLLFSGMRRGEVLGFRWGDFNFKLKTIEVRRKASYAHNQAQATTPKTSNGYRILPCMNSFSIRQPPDFTNFNIL